MWHKKTMLKQSWDWLASQDDLVLTFPMLSCRKFACFFFSALSRLRDHPLKTSANFHDFWPLPPSAGSFFTTIHRQIGQFLIPSPLKEKNAYALIDGPLIKLLSCLYFPMFNQVPFKQTTNYGRWMNRSKILYSPNPHPKPKSPNPLKCIKILVFAEKMIE